MSGPVIPGRVPGELPGELPGRLPGETVWRESADETLDTLAGEMMVHAMSCVRACGSFHMALSGGSTPMPLYRRLMIGPEYREFPWSHTHLWIVDERRVPFDDERSNFGTIREVLVEHSGIPSAHVHPMDGAHDDADVRYEAELVRELAARGRGKDRLDFVLLGMGADGHTASLFPGSPASTETRRLVRFNDGPKVTPPARITMTFPLINSARFIAVLVTGKSKRETLKKVAARAGGVQALPILGVAPLGGSLRWYVDGEAWEGSAGDASIPLA